MLDWRKVSMFGIVWSVAAAAIAVDQPSHFGKFQRDFDARNALAESLVQQQPSAAQLRAEDALRASVPELAVGYDGFAPAARTVMNRTGYLTGASFGTPLEIGTRFVQEHLDLFGLSLADVSSFEVTDEVVTRHSGTTHLYLRQIHDGLPVYNGQLHFNINREGKILSVNNAFQPNISASVNSLQPALSAQQAVAAGVAALGLGSYTPASLSEAVGRGRHTRVDGSSFSRNATIEARLMWLPIRAGETRLVWNFQFETLDGESWYDVNVDAVSGQLWTAFDWVDEASNRAYPFNVESPNHTTPLPPADARQLLVDPHDPNASPFGWHDTNGAAGAEFTIHRGNNTHAWEDSDGNDSPPPAGTEPDCGASLVCDFPIDLTQAPSTYRPGSVSNLFYWTNIIHDVLWQYGFDEPGGNFQVNNYGRGGNGNDDVQALAQAAGNCNANFGTPPDGSRPRMRMFNCTNTTPARDGDLDHAVIIHEYGHGISNRLVGGPSNTSCLGNTQQPGEGWSDWYGLALTAQAGDVGTTLRGMGTYLFGQPANGPGIRPQPYSTDPGINSYTYATIGTGVSVPHGLGSVWAQAIWEVYWALVAEHGHDPDLYDGTGSAGNQRAIFYVTEGLKNTACGPTFLNTRDGIIQAAADNFGGEDVCLLWEAFAAFGLGSNASTPGPSSTSATNGFEIPASCSFFGSPNPAAEICAGTDANYTVTLGNAFTPPVNLSATPPGSANIAFGTNPVNSVPGNSTVTVSNTGGLGAGDYTITVNGNDAAPSLNTFDLDLTVYSGAPPAPGLTAPANGSTDVPTKPTLSWTAAAGAAEYLVEVATDAGFGNIVASTTVTGTSHQLAGNLAADTEHFWRVTPANPCASGAVSTVFSFTTVNLICDSPGLAIPDSPGAAVFDEMVLGSGGSLTDLNVIIRATHTFVGDLAFTLSKTGGPSATVIDRPGRTTTGFGCSGNDIDATLDDEASDPVENECEPTAPTIAGTFTPNNPLSVFDGQSLAGTWRMTVQDFAGGDTGTLVEWCLAPAENLLESIFADGFEGGNTGAWSATVP